MSTLTEEEHAARSLVEARRWHRPAAAPALSSTAAAYAVQQAVAHAAAWFADGPPRHWKSGGPSRDALQTHAALPPTGVWRSPATAGQWPFHRRWIEAEIALRLGRPVDAALAASLAPAGAGALVDSMCVSIEIVDSRWAEGLDAPPMARLADLQSHGALVLGDWVPFEARDWMAQACRVRIGGRAVVERRGSHPMGDPVFVLPAWLRHATADGAVLPAGTVVTTGAWAGMLEADRGDVVEVEFEGIGHARVHL